MPLRLLLAVLVFVATVGVTDRAAAAFSDCWTSTTKWSATVNCYTNRHQAHVGCRASLFALPHYVHGPVRYGVGASTAACTLGETRFTHWYTY